MRAIKLGLAVAAVVCSGAALAADLPTRKGPPPAPYAPQQVSAFTWAGPYIGGFVGGNWSRLTSTDTTTGGIGIPNLTTNGLTGGGLAGFNWGFPGASSFVIGGEIEGGYDRRSGSVSYTGAFGAPTSLSEDGNVEGRVRGRIGYAWNRFLLFAAGGGSIEDLRLTSSTGFGSEQERFWRGGWNIGGGLDWAFSDHWIVRGEYIFDQFGNREYGFNGQNAAFDNVRARPQESTARAALVYKF